MDASCTIDPGPGLTEEKFRQMRENCVLVCDPEDVTLRDEAPKISAEHRFARELSAPRQHLYCGRKHAGFFRTCNTRWRKG